MTKRETSLLTLIKIKNGVTTTPKKKQAETFLSLVINYGYPVNRIKQYLSVQMGSETKEADIIVYADDECEETYILVECKKEEIIDQQFKIAADQAYSYCVAEGGKYVWTTSKIINEYYEIPKERPRSRISIPDIPQFGVNKLAAYKYVKGGFLQSERETETINLASEPDLNAKQK